jgi:hypothetical protein
MDGAMPRYIKAHNIISDESLTLMFDVRICKANRRIFSCISISNQQLNMRRLAYACAHKTSMSETRRL